MKTWHSRLLFVVMLAGTLGVLSMVGAAPGPPPSGRPKVRISFQAYKGSLRSVAFSSDSKKLFSLGDDENFTAKLWDAETGKHITTFLGARIGKKRAGEKLSEAIGGVAVLSPDGKRIASAGIDRSIRLWDVATGKKLATLEQPEGGLPALLLFSPDGKELLSLGSTSYLWKLETKKERLVMEGLNMEGTNQRLLKAVAFDPRGTPHVITWDNWSNPPSFHLWTPASKKTIAVSFKIPIHNSVSFYSRDFAFSPDCQTIASALGDGSIRLWDAATGENTATLKNLPGQPFDLMFSPDGKLLTACYTHPRKRDALPEDPVRRFVCIHDVATGKVLAKLEGDPDLILPFAFSPDGRTLATGDGGSKITLWSLPSRYKAE